MDPAIETTALRREFGDVVAVDGLNLVVKKGTLFGFLGPNGAGKSTTIKMLTGLLGPSAGSARILGHDVVADSVAAKKVMGVVPEESALFERLTGPEYLCFVGRMYGLVFVGLMIYASMFSNNFLFNAYAWEGSGVQSFFLRPAGQLLESRRESLIEALQV